ncbi:unnamed protein product [Prorocentrum cordatum]|uniref:Uncharacterized protein n=1 Tax=Prorocentrum cordatum TaxID=2364126 RepID=A0ABN9X1D6_9DINO|nr:unnamed protein product [Polarella glacialis]
MPKARTSTVCNARSAWVYDWKLARPDGWCDTRNDYMSAPQWQPQGSQETRAGRPPWWNSRSLLPTPEQELDAIIKKFETKKGGYTLDVDVQALRDFRDMIESAAPRKPKREMQQSSALTQAVNKKEQAQKELDSATAALLAAQKRLEEAQRAQDAAALNMEEAESEHLKVLDEYYAQSKPTEHLDGHADQAWRAPEVDEALVQDIDEFQPEDKAKLLKFKPDMHAYNQYKEFDELAKQAKELQRAHQEAKRRKVGEEDATAVAAPSAPAAADAPTKQEEPKDLEEEEAATRARRKAAPQRLKDESMSRPQARKAPTSTPTPGTTGTMKLSKHQNGDHEQMDERGR